MTAPATAGEDIAQLLSGTHSDPHRYLGLHRREGTSWVVRCRRPDATRVDVVVDGRIIRMARVHDDADLFALDLDTFPRSGYRLVVHRADGSTESVGDPYRFAPTLGEFDLHLIGTGRHHDLWNVLGGRLVEHADVPGAAFAVWAPNARAVRVVGDWNGWDGRVHPLRRLGDSGVWELFVPLLESGARYKYEIVDADGGLSLRADPLARRSEHPPQSASVLFRSNHEWADGDWMQARAARPFDGRLSIYEVHLGSWQQMADPSAPDGTRPLSYLELADRLVDHVANLGFSHVELLPVAEHPYTPSWGYQVTGYYAPTARYGSPDELRALIDAFHRRGVGVLLDWVPAHFPRDAFALARFDGTALYEHEDPRRGAHPDWGTLIFNYGRPEVRNFLIANALYWFEEFHIDGIRVDAVASMLYLDYSRAAGEWLPNHQGGRENLDAIDFLRELNRVVHGRFDGVLTIAEESTSWPGVSKPVDADGLGFTHKWNMGWMHDTLDYFAREPVHRRWHHNHLTFGLMYAWSENFMLPLSHDEVVHGKGSLIERMPGDRWQKMANLRALLAWMWAHPGKQTLFMGGEFAQWAEWDADRSLDWHLLQEPDHEGMIQLVAELNRVQSRQRALWTADFDPAGFRWLDGDDGQHSVYSFVRFGAPAPNVAPEDDAVVVVANLTPVPRPGYRIGLPFGGRWHEVLSTDASRFGGTGVDNGPRAAEPLPWHGCGDSTQLDLPPLGVVWLGREMPEASSGVGEG